MNTLVAHPHMFPIRLTRRQLLALGICFLCVVGMASAGTTGDDFKELYEDAKDWADGYLGRTIAMMSFLLGAGWSAARQNMMPVIFGLILALIISVGPALLEKVLSAVV